MNSIFEELKQFEPCSVQTIITKFKLINVNHPLLLKLYNLCLKILKKEGTIWIFSENIIFEDYLIPIPLILGEKLKDLGFILKNLIVHYNINEPQNSLILENRYSNILFLTKKIKEYKFNKDPIREKHIWKDVEWSGGRKNRYHEKGKDPSNFWLKTEDNGKGKITKHIILSDLNAIERIIKASTDKNDKILFIQDKKNNLELNFGNLISIEIDTSFNNNLENIRKDLFIAPKKIEESLAYKEIIKSEIHIKSSESMDDLSDNSIQTIITSPPYWGLRDYNHQNQIGHNSTYLEYLERLNKVWKECHRVLRDTGTLWININKRIKDGDMILFPYDFFINIRNLDFRLLDIVIWHKPIAVSAYGTKNLGDRYEYILVFAKSSKFKINENFELQDPDYLHEYNENLSNVWKLFRKIGTIGKEVSIMIKSKKIKHTAIYPKELVRRIILLTSDKNDVILDPFAGSGTTLVVADELNRKWIGYEINPNYVEIIKYRIKEESKRIKTLDEFF